MHPTSSPKAGCFLFCDVVAEKCGSDKRSAKKQRLFCSTTFRQKHVNSQKSDWLLNSAITRVCAFNVRVRENSGVAIQIDFWTDVDFRRKYIQDKNRDLVGGFKGGGEASPLVKKSDTVDWHFLESCNIYASCPEGKNFCKYFSRLGLGLFANTLKKICIYF